jgi:hypothetical protein
VWHLFGGNNLTDTFDDFWKIDLKPIVDSSRAAAVAGTSSSSSSLEPNSEWIQIPSEPSRASPSARIGHTMTAIGSNFFVLYGGRNYLGGTMANGLFLLLSLEADSPSLSLSQESISTMCCKVAGGISPLETLTKSFPTGQDTVASRLLTG